jgi:hypothetical protein
MEAEDPESCNPEADDELRTVKYEPVIEGQSTASDRRKRGNGLQQQVDNSARQYND